MMKQERVAAVARERHSGHTLFQWFVGNTIRFGRTASYSKPKA